MHGEIGSPYIYFGWRLLIASPVVCCLGLCHAADAKIIKFDPRESIYTEPNDINTAGSITGFYMDKNEKVHSFLRTLGRVDKFEPVTGRGQV